MLFGRSFRLIDERLKLNVLFKRKISEYAKNMGYKPKPATTGPRINHAKNIVCLVGSAILIGDVISDRREHYKAFMKNYDERKKYYKPSLSINITGKPNMDFLLDDIFLPPLGDGNDTAQCITKN